MNQEYIAPSAPPRMRTAAGALEIIRAGDPDTAVSMHYLRQLIATGEIPSVVVGRKKLVNVDKLLVYLGGGAGKEA